MKKLQKYRLLIIVVSSVVLIILLYFVLPGGEPPNATRMYAWGHAYVPARGADAYFENVWKYVLNEAEFIEAYNIMMSSNTWYKLGENEFEGFRSWYKVMQSSNIFVNKDKIDTISSEFSYYCMYDIYHKKYIEEKDSASAPDCAVFILDCSTHNYYCLYLPD